MTRTGPEAIDLDSSIRSVPLTAVTEAFSHASLELVTLPRGREVVVKRLPADGDWLTRATGGSGRLRQLWDAGVLHRVADVVDHAILDVQVIDGADVVIMRDVSQQLLPPDVGIDSETVTRILDELATFHAASEGEPDAGWCTIGDRYAMFAPRSMTGDDSPGRHPVADRIVAGWELFAEHSPDDIVQAVFAVHNDPTRLTEAMSGSPWTLLHGDAKPENLGLSDDGLVAIDWGELTGVGPREVDVGWFAVKAVTRAECLADDVFELYSRAVGEPLDPMVVDLVLLGSLAQMGFRFALGAFGNGLDRPDEARRQLDWWTFRVGAALDYLAW